MTTAFERARQLLKQLPGLGYRSAERIALHLLAEHPERLEPLLAALRDAAAILHRCPRCGNLCEDAGLCGICADSRRDARRLCIVERIPDLLALERAHAHDGLYHVLHGKLSPIQGIGPEHLNLATFAARLDGTLSLRSTGNPVCASASLGSTDNPVCASASLGSTDNPVCASASLSSTDNPVCAPASLRSTGNPACAPTSGNIPAPAVTEVILALSNDIEGEATCHYLQDTFLRPRPAIATSRIGFGIPSGGGLTYADPATLRNAIDARRQWSAPQ